MKKKLFINCMVLVMTLLPGSVFARMPNDPEVQQWSYEDTGVFRAWDTTTGSSSTIVAIIDNGFDTFHPDLIDNVWKNTKEIPANGIDDDHNGYIDDVYGWNFVENSNNPQPDVSALTDTQRKDEIYNHGTLVAGIIGASGNNGIDGAGINWHVKLMNLKILGNTGTGSVTPLSSAIHYAVDNGASVINISMVGTDNGEDSRDAIRYAYQHGVVIVVAAGNSMLDLNKSPQYPVCADAKELQTSVIGVSAIGEAHRLSSFSNAGSNCIDIAAPGEDIGSTVRYAPEQQLKSQYETGYNGTSFAAPFVSGAAALVKSIHPEWTAKEIVPLLLSTTHHTPSPDENAYADAYGKGLLQVDLAVEKAKSIAPVLSMSPVVVLPKAAVLQIIPPTPSPKNEEKQFSLWRINLGTGKSDTLSSSGLASSLPNFSKIDSITQVVDQGNLFMVTSAGVKKNSSQITVWNAENKVVRTWTVPYAHVQIKSGNILGNGAPQLVVAPIGTSKTVYELYSLAGKRLSQVSVKTAQTGAVIAVIPQGTEKMTIAALYKEKSKFVMHLYTGTTLTKAWTIPWMKTLGSVTGFVANAQPYIAVGAGMGQGSLVTTYTTNGALQRQFNAFDGVTDGVVLSHVDAYDGENGVLVIGSARQAGRPVKIYSESVLLLKEYPSTQKTGTGTFLLLVDQPLLTN